MGRPSYLPLIASLLAKYAARKPDASFVVLLSEIGRALNRGAYPYMDSSIATATDPQIADILAQMVDEASCSVISPPLVDDRVLRCWADDAEPQTLPPYSTPLLIQANEADLIPARVTVTFVDEGGTRHQVAMRCLWEHRMPLGWWTMLLRIPGGEEANPSTLWLVRPCETLPGLLDLATRELHVALGERPQPAAGAPPWLWYNLTASTTGREYNEAIECPKAGGAR